MTFTSQPTILAPQGKVKSCGIHIVGIADQPGSDTVKEAFDGSIGLHVRDPEPFALVKAILKRGELAQGFEAFQSTGKQIAWFRAAEGATLLPKDGLIPSETPGYEMYGADPLEAMRTIVDVSIGKPFRISFKGGPDRERIYSGTAALSVDARKALQGCLAELLVR